MRQLLTPIVLENAVDGLNSVHPFLIKDDYSIILDYPAGCINPIGCSNPALMKLLRSDDKGVLLKSYYNKFTDYEFYGFYLTARPNIRTVVFWNVIKHLSVYFNIAGVINGWLYWVTPSNIVLKQFVKDIRTPVFTRGRVFKFYADGASGFAIYVEVYGFY
jgi:hypothetical protein